MTTHRRTKRAALGFFFLAGFVALVLAGVGRYFAEQENQRRYEEEKANLRPRQPNLFEVTKESHSRVREYSAEVLPWASAHIAAEVAGNILTVHVEHGDVVTSGEALVEMDSTLAAVALRSAEAQHAENERLLRESERLAERNVASRTELEAARARLEMSAAERDRAAEMLDRHTIKAPFDGTVSERHVDPGDAMQIGQTVVTIEDFEKFRIVFFANENEIGAFREGRKIELLVPGLAGKTWEPEVRFVSRSADRGTRLFRVEAVMEDAPEDFRSGLQAVVRAEVETFQDTLFVPASAVRIEGRNARVLMAGTDGDPAQRDITIGPEVDGRYPVFSGLEEGDTIILR